VIIVSAVRAFPVDLSGILFGDILALHWTDVAVTALVAAATIGVLALAHRPLTALSFDPRIAHTLGLRPRTADAVLLGSLAVAIVASYQSVGTLLVVGLMVAPPAAAAAWARSVTTMMVLATAIAGISVGRTSRLLARLMGGRRRHRPHRDRGLRRLHRIAGGPGPPSSTLIW